jgi:hypothetical protein
MIELVYDFYTWLCYSGTGAMRRVKMRISNGGHLSLKYIRLWVSQYIPVLSRTHISSFPGAALSKHFHYPR